MPAGTDTGYGSEPVIRRIHGPKSEAVERARAAGLVVLEGRYGVHKYMGEQEPGNPNPADLYEIVECDPNLFLTAGINDILKLIAGQGGTAYTAANARLAVGDGTTPPAAGQTDLVGTNKARQVVDAAPTITNNQILFVATFGTGSANYVWAEVGVVPAASGGPMWSRSVPNGTLGTKPTSGTATWVLNWTLTIN
jgi:hypothetical protein